MQLDSIFLFLILILSVVIHEVTHGYVAQALGDPTARLAGRLTLNPLKHIDPLGSIILPGLLLLSHSSFLFGWAKPVPYNPYNIRSRFGEAFVAGSGPAVNLLIAIIFGLLVRFGQGFLPLPFLNLAAAIVVLNILLAIVNLIPIPPLDGSKVLGALLPGSLSLSYERIRISMERNIFAAFAIVIVALYLLGPVVERLILLLAGLLMGSSF